jgi:hypothetical protein
MLASYLSGPRLTGEELGEAMDKIEAAMRSELAATTVSPKSPEAIRKANYRAKKRILAIEDHSQRDNVPDVQPARDMSQNGGTHVPVDGAALGPINGGKLPETGDQSDRDTDGTNWDNVPSASRDSNLSSSSSSSSSSFNLLLSDRQESESPRARGTKPASAKGTKLPEDWTLPPAWELWARQQGLDAETIQIEAAKFHTEWLGRGTCRPNWRATWQNWIWKEIGRRREIAERDARFAAERDARQAQRNAQRETDEAAQRYRAILGHDIGKAPPLASQARH